MIAILAVNAEQFREFISNRDSKSYKYIKSLDDVRGANFEDFIILPNAQYKDGFPEILKECHISIRRAGHQV